MSWGILLEQIKVGPKFVLSTAVLRGRNNQILKTLNEKTDIRCTDCGFDKAPKHFYTVWNKDKSRQYKKSRCKDCCVKRVMECRQRNGK